MVESISINSTSNITINLPKSEYKILGNNVLLDTPFHNYSDQLDEEIVDRCADVAMYVLVTSCVGSLGHHDEEILIRISEKKVINKIVFIFTGIEQVPDKEVMRTEEKYQNNAFELMNKFVFVYQENNFDKIVFSRNNMETEKINMFLDISQSNDSDLEKYIRNQYDEVLKLKENITNQMNETKAKIEVEETRFKEQNANKRNSEECIKEQQMKTFGKLIKSIKNFKQLLLRNSQFVKDIDNEMKNINEILIAYDSKFEKLFNYNKESNSSINIGINEKFENKALDSSSNSGTNGDSDPLKILTDDGIIENCEPLSVINLEMKTIDLYNIISQLNYFLKYLPPNHGKMPEYIQQILEILRDILNDNDKKSLSKINTILEIHDKIISKIHFVDIESSHEILIFLLLIEVLFVLIIADKQNISNNSNSTLFINYYKSDVKKLKENLKRLKFSDKMDQLNVDKNPIYLESEVDPTIEISLIAEKNKLEIMEKIEKYINNLITKMEECCQFTKIEEDNIICDVQF